MPIPFRTQSSSSQPMSGETLSFPSGGMLHSASTSDLSLETTMPLLQNTGLAGTESPLTFNTYGAMNGSLGYIPAGLNYEFSRLPAGSNVVPDSDMSAMNYFQNGDMFKNEHDIGGIFGANPHTLPSERPPKPSLPGILTNTSDNSIKEEPEMDETLEPQTSAGSDTTSVSPLNKLKSEPTSGKLPDSSFGGGSSSGTKSQHGTWRRNNKVRTPLQVKRSQSTPNVQLAAQLAAASVASAPPMPTASTTDDIASASLAYQLDKKRNKLGYHRTSVACGHCRRRKIRCILAKDESGRCSNCIRLKKECSFYPVEATDRRPRSASKPEISQIFQENSSSPSSPTRSPRLSVDHINIPPLYEGNVYPSSLPITPNYDCDTPTSTFDDSLRHRSLSSSSRMSSFAMSNAGSRRPSLAHMFTAPLPSREFRSLSDASPTYADTLSTFASRYGNNSKLIGIGIEDPTSTFWRLDNSSSVFSPLAQHVNFGGMPALEEDSIKHTRLNSVDNGIGPMHHTSYADATGYSLATDLSMENMYANGAKPLTHLQTGIQFESENTNNNESGYGITWSEMPNGLIHTSDTSATTENWFPQQGIVDSSFDQDFSNHRVIQTPVRLKHQ